MNDDKHTPITRRDFVRGTLAAALSASGPAKLWALPADRTSTVVLVRDEKAIYGMIVV